MKIKGQVLIVLNIIIVIGLIMTLAFGVKHYKEMSNNSSGEEYQINTIVNTVNGEAANIEKISEVKQEDNSSTEVQNKRNDTEGESCLINSTKKVMHKSSSNNSAHAGKSSKKVRNVTKAPKKQETSTETSTEEEVTPIEVINTDSGIDTEDKSKINNAEIKDQPSNNSGNQSEKPVEQPATSEGGISISNNTKTDNLSNNNEIEGNFSNNSENKE